MPSIYTRFIEALRKEWAGSLPAVRRVARAPSPTLPAASTFYAGEIPGAGKHVLLNFQHSTKAWEVGRFTVNLVIAADPDAPSPQSPGRGAFPSRTEGCYRLGSVLHGKDKWWYLADTRPSVLGVAWRPTSYADAELVIREAVEDVSRDIRAVLQELGIPA